MVPFWVYEDESFAIAKVIPCENGTVSELGPKSFADICSPKNCDKERISTFSVGLLTIKSSVIFRSVKF